MKKCMNSSPGCLILPLSNVYIYRGQDEDGNFVDPQSESRTLCTYLKVMTAMNRPEDTEKLNTVFEQYGRLMYHVAYQILGSSYSAEDAVQEAFLRIAQRPDSIADARSTRTKVYVLTIVRHIAFDMLRAAGRTEPSDPESMQRTAVTGPAEGPGLLEAIRELPENYRTLIILRFHEGYSVKEIAGMLGMNEGAVQRSLYRAKKRLEAMLERED